MWPGDAVGLVLALGHRRVAWALGALGRLRQVALGHGQARRGVGLAALDLVAGQLAAQHRVHALDACGHLAVGDALHLERVQARSEEHTSELQSLMRISYAV